MPMSPCRADQERPGQASTRLKVQTPTSMSESVELRSDGYRLGSYQHSTGFSRTLEARGSVDGVFHHIDVDPTVREAIPL